MISKWGKMLLVVVIFVVAFVLVACSASSKVHYPTSPQYNGKKFVNPTGSFEISVGEYISLIKSYLFEKRVAPTPQQAVPLKQLSKAALIENNQSGTALYRLGHSSLLLAVDGEFWLIDPVFSERVSPVSWAGPKRFHPTPINLSELPPIKGVVISHDHYDHLDEPTISALAEQAEYFVVPLGIGRYLKKWQVGAEKIQELDWWQSFETPKLTFTATPSQHFSGRGLTDRDQTLWASWVIKTAQQNIYFSGDTGYFDGFKTIGERLGPFDLAILENGAYNKLWPNIHMQPEDTMQAYLDLGAKALMPVHNSTFDLSLHPWFEPLQRIQALAATHQVKVITPIIGQQVKLPLQQDYDYWWQQMKSYQALTAKAQ